MVRSLQAGKLVLLQPLIDGLRGIGRSGFKLNHEGLLLQGLQTGDVGLGKDKVQAIEHKGLGRVSLGRWSGGAVEIVDIGHAAGVVSVTDGDKGIAGRNTQVRELNAVGDNEAVHFEL